MLLYNHRQRPLQWCPLLYGASKRNLPSVRITSLTLLHQLPRQTGHCGHPNAHPGPGQSGKVQTARKVCMYPAPEHPVHSTSSKSPKIPSPSSSHPSPTEKKNGPSGLLSTRSPLVSKPCYFGQARPSPPEDTTPDALGCPSFLSFPC